MDESILEYQSTHTFSLYYDVYLPKTLTTTEKKPLVIGTHGYGGDKTSMMRLLRRIHEEDFVFASLQGPHQHMVYPKEKGQPLGYGFGWLTSFRPEESITLHHQAIREIITTLNKAGHIDLQKVFLLGFSQAVALNFRFALTYPDYLCGVIAICGGIPSDLEKNLKYQHRSSCEVLYLAGKQDEFYSPERIELASQSLKNYVKKVDLRFFDVGHEVPYDSYPLIYQWIQETLKNISPVSTPSTDEE